MNILESQFILENLIVIFSLFLILVIPRYAKVFWSLQSVKQNVVNNKSRLHSIDTLKGLAIIGVIIIHACYLLLNKYSGYEAIILTFINNIFRFAIPIFLFSSGLLLKPFVWQFKYIFHFYMSKVLRITVPYILVNIALWQIGYNDSASLLQLIVTGKMAIPFYFIPVLFQLYLLYPILDYCRRISPQYLLLASLIVSIISFLTPSTWQIGEFPLFTQYLVFFVYGMVRQDVIKVIYPRAWFELLLIYFILNIILASVIPFILIEQNIWESIYFYNFQIILGFGFIFTSLYYLEAKKLGHQILNKIFSPLGKLSLWIFLLHFPIQQILFNSFEDNYAFLALELMQNIFLTCIITVPLAWILHYFYSIPRFPQL
jgi:peptidoglycan/LPS O-acetylase OafA/YrhL